MISWHYYTKTTLDFSNEAPYVGDLKSYLLRKSANYMQEDVGHHMSILALESLKERLTCDINGG
jgi:hypothetical protein